MKKKFLGSGLSDDDRPRASCDCPVPTIPRWSPQGGTEALYSQFLVTWRIAHGDGAFFRQEAKVLYRVHVGALASSPYLLSSVGDTTGSVR